VRSLVTRRNESVTPVIWESYASPVNRHRVLVAISAAQLAAGVAGQVIAVRDRRPFDTPLLGQRGRPEDVLRDSVFNGTALSAPITMLLTQAVATVRLAQGPSTVAARTLGVLGATMTCGYMVEREFPRAFTPAGLDPVVTPVAAGGLALAVAMARSGLRRW
jgi:hypothetical protein